MADRLSEVVLVLQRMGENAKLRGDDLAHIQAQERRDHAWWLNQQLKMAEEVVDIFRDELNKFGAVAAHPPRQQLPAKPSNVQNIPSSVALK